MLEQLGWIHCLHQSSLHHWAAKGVIVSMSTHRRQEMTRTPMGLALSVKAHWSPEQMQLPLIGSQKGVEQLAGTNKPNQSNLENTEAKRNEKRTSQTGLISGGNFLFGIRVLRGGWLFGAAILSTAISFLEMLQRRRQRTQV